MSSEPLTASDEPILEPDDDAVEDSAYCGSDTDSTFTASLTSSVLNYPTENGRRYHAFREGRYLFPNDEEENDRLDMMHCALGLMMGQKLHYAPIGNAPQRVLDIGTGTGIWAMEFGDEYPSAEVLGNDLSASQPTMVPPNVKFEIDDIESQWTNGTFDYIHCRYMAGAISNWPRLVKSCFAHTRPGGWTEFQDFDYYTHDDDGSQMDTSFCEWNRFALQGLEKAGLDPRPGPQLEGWVRDAGFVDVQIKRFKVPLGRWPKDAKMKHVGAWFLLNMLEGLGAMSLAIFTRYLGWSVDEVEVLLAKARADLRTGRMHAYEKFWVVYGRRPKKS